MITTSEQSTFQDCYDGLISENQALLARQEVSDEVVKCSYCGLFQLPKEENVEPPMMPLFGLNGNITDTICPDCEEKAYEFEVA